MREDILQYWLAQDLRSILFSRRDLAYVQDTCELLLDVVYIILPYLPITSVQ